MKLEMALPFQRIMRLAAGLHLRFFSALICGLEMRSACGLLHCVRRCVRRCMKLKMALPFQRFMRLAAGLHLRFF
jgi:hypothetical protein